MEGKLFNHASLSNFIIKKKIAIKKTLRIKKWTALLSNITIMLKFSRTGGFSLLDVMDGTPKYDHLYARDSHPKF